MKITGETKLVGIIGYPLTYTCSPVFQNAGFEVLGLDWCYLPLVVRENKLEEAVEGIKALGFVGFNVTTPYKEKVLSLLDELSQEAELTGAVNTVLIRDDKLVGLNTDGQGFLTSLKKEANFDPSFKNVLIFGAGGAAKAISVTLAKEEANSIVITDCVFSKAEALAKTLANNFPKVEVKTEKPDTNLSKAFLETDLVINATPVGMEKEQLPFSVEHISKKHLVADLIYQPQQTLLLKKAKKKKAQVLSGAGMLLYQGALAFKAWTGFEAPVEIMREALQNALR